MHSFVRALNDVDRYTKTIQYQQYWYRQGLSVNSCYHHKRMPFINKWLPEVI